MKTKKKIILTMIYDIKLFPPVLSLCSILSDLNYEVIYIGSCSDDKILKELSSFGVKIYKTNTYGGNGIKRFFQQLKYRKHVKNIIKKEYNKNNTYIWLLHTETASLFTNLLGQFNIIVHLLEFKNPREKIAYKILNPFSNINKRINLATKIVCCEYNRAHIAKAIYNLNSLPYILPNKPYIKEINNDYYLPIEIKNKIEKYVNKRIILYQGIFIPERKLDDYINAMNYLSDDYVMFLMGNQNNLYYELKKKYESDRIIFLPFLSPPTHLEITRRAYIGILTYIPDEHTIDQAINVLYCAPNKLYEYSMFGIPMIANDLPALRFAFSQNKGGICVKEMEAKQIATAINELNKNYNIYSQASYDLYNNVNMLNIVKEIIR